MRTSLRVFAATTLVPGRAEGVVLCGVEPLAFGAALTSSLGGLSTDGTRNMAICSRSRFSL